MSIVKCNFRILKLSIPPAYTTESPGSIPRFRRCHSANSTQPHNLIPAANGGRHTVPPTLSPNAATREITPTTTHNHSISPSTRPRQPVLRCHSRHLMRLDFLSVRYVTIRAVAHLMGLRLVTYLTPTSVPTADRRRARPSRP